MDDKNLKNLENLKEVEITNEDLEDVAGGVKESDTELVLCLNGSHKRIPKKPSRPN